MKLIDFNNKAYEYNKLEKEVLDFWDKNKFFEPEYKDERDETFTIILPPPNANSPLHLGTMSGNTIQDILGRYNRMNGKKVLLLPGKDHAAIQTEVVFEKVLQKRGIRKRDLKREEFYNLCYEFCMENAKIAREQEKNIGLSADYSREKFTLDENITKIVYETFKKMFEEDGLVYRGKRIINWCVRCQTALSDIDTEYQEEDSKLYYIKYGELTVATTRPETKMADVALAVNPKDKRYRHLIGKVIDIDSIEGKRSLPVLGDSSVDINFGTGVLKVTPGHSKEDFRLGEKYNLPIIMVIDTNGKMTFEKYKGMKVKEAREKVVEDLDKMGLLEKVSDIKHNIQVCERCKSVIEPLVSYQWFVKTKELARSLIDEGEKGNPKIYPKRQEKNYLRFLENIEDWCISRQQWWGQRIPAYYCGGKITKINESGDITEEILGCGNIFVSIDKPKECPRCKSKKIVQDEDIFDTWFSSTQWPFSSLGGINGKDFKEFYPTNVMETGRDILFFWVARMGIMGLYVTEKIPFKTVYLHGLVLDKDGKKQSKSRGNGIDPKDMIDKYGRDALRLSLVSSVAPDQDFRLFEEKIKGYRNFINKVYNSSRLIFMMLEKNKNSLPSIKNSYGAYSTKTSINISREMTDHVKKINRLFKNYEIGLVAFELQNFYHHIFCDIYLEAIKPHQDDPKALGEILYVFYQNILLLHPFIPFITEHIFQDLKRLGYIDTENETMDYEIYPKL